MSVTTNQMPGAGFLRIWQIVGDKKKNITPLIPICRTSFLNGVRSGKYPKGILIGKRTRVWKVEDIEKLIVELGSSA